MQVEYWALWSDRDQRYALRGGFGGGVATFTTKHWADEYLDHNGLYNFGYLPVLVEVRRAK